MTKNSKAVQQSGDQQVITDIKIHFTNVALITFATGSHAPVALAQLYRARIDAAANTAQKEGEYHAAVKAEKAAEEALLPVALAFKEYVLSVNGKQPEVLDDFGSAPKKKAAAAATAAVAPGTTGTPKA